MLEETKDVSQTRELKAALLGFLAFINFIIGNKRCLPDKGIESREIRVDITSCLYNETKDVSQTRELKVLQF